MRFHFRNPALHALLLIPLLLGLAGCDKMLPSDYNEETTTITEMDSKACAMIGADTDSVAFLPVVPSLLSDLAGAGARETDPAVVKQIFATRLAEIARLERDTLMLVTPPAGLDSTNADTSFAVLVNGSDAASMTLYVSWAFTEANVDDYVEVTLIGEDGSFPARFDTFPIEAVSGCIEDLEFEDTGHRYVLPRLRTRCRYDGTGGTYLVRFIVSSPVDLRSFKVVILPE